MPTIFCMGGLTACSHVRCENRTNKPSSCLRSNRWATPLRRSCPPYDCFSAPRGTAVRGPPSAVGAGRLEGSRRVDPKAAGPSVHQSRRRHGKWWTPLVGVIPTPRSTGRMGGREEYDLETSAWQQAVLSRDSREGKQAPDSPNHLITDSRRRRSLDHSVTLLRATRRRALGCEPALAGGGRMPLVARGILPPGTLGLNTVCPRDDPPDEGLAGRNGRKGHTAGGA